MYTILGIMINGNVELLEMHEYNHTSLIIIHYLIYTLQFIV